jgi:ketosteroid isomerase-like protein
MPTAENKKLLQDIFTGLAAGDSKLFVEKMAANFRWHLTGSTGWSKGDDGKDTVLKELLAPLRSRIDGRIKTVPKRFIADGDLVAVEARGDNRTVKGEPYNNNYCFVFRLENGMLVEVTEYLDTELVTSALGAPDRGV